MSEQEPKTKAFLGVHPAYALGVVLILASIVIFQLI